MSNSKRITPVQHEPGRPLYLSARDHIRNAIEIGTFSPGEQIPSTVELSQQMGISLVTAHRALQELVNCGVLRRSQGRGTFVHIGYVRGQSLMSQCRLGILLGRDVSLADYHISMIMEGVRQAAHMLDIELNLLRPAEDVRRHCDAMLYIAPLPDDLQQAAAASNSPRGGAALVIGARAEGRAIDWMDIDNQQLARDAVSHLLGQDHLAIGYVGRGDDSFVAAERWGGYIGMLRERSVEPRSQWVVKSPSWHLDERQRAELIRMLSGPGRPTAIFAAGYEFALEVYTTARTLGLQVGRDLSIVGVDDPPSAAHLFPALTTVRQPLIQLGQSAVTALVERVRYSDPTPGGRLMRAELVIRQSSGPSPRRTELLAGKSA